jgi:hypothetical protein
MSSLMKNESIKWYHALGDCLSQYKVLLICIQSVFSFFVQDLMLIDVTFHLEYSIKIPPLHPFGGSSNHGHSYQNNISTDDQIGLRSKIFIEICFGLLEIFICY